MKLTANFSEIYKTDTDIAGGKGASLGEMTNVGINVPPGFVLLASAFDRFLEETNLLQEISSLISKVNYDDIDSVEKTSVNIRALIDDVEMPGDIEMEVGKQFNGLGSKFVAVRSSATAEDSSDASWAGELESYLNTREENLLENIKKCWSSLFTPRAIFYRREKNLHEKHISVAVVVQEMIESEVSGICFTVHPVTEDEQQMILEAVWGLGEAIVSGAVTPDSYVLDKRDWSTIAIDLNAQEKQLVRDGECGNKWIELVEDRKGKQILSNERIVELAQICARIEKHYDYPQDIEWAYREGQFFITQSRPITTLKTLQKPIEKIELVNTQTREHSLFYAKVWSDVNTKLYDQYLAGTNVENILFVRRVGESLTKVYYDEDELSSVFERTASLLNQDPQTFLSLEALVEDNLEKMVKYLEGGQDIKNIEELKNFTKYWKRWWVGMSFIFAIPNINSVNEEIRNKALVIRERIEKYSGTFDAVYQNFIKDNYPQYGDLVDVLLPEEVYSLAEGAFGGIQLTSINERLSGFAMLNGNLFSLEELEEELGRRNVFLQKEEILRGDKISGTIAFAGVARGKVVLVSTLDQLGKVDEGDILVTHMTSPDFLPAMKKCGAIVTDEGGLTCHAAIVARELEIPCIIGTKNATRFLSDGDLVEVDAESGVVRILNENEDQF